MTNVDPLLGPLADHGGATLTHALLPGSPAIDAGSLDCPGPSLDQRGAHRPADGDDNGSARCDIGSFEYASEVLPALVGDADCDGGTNSLDASIVLQQTAKLLTAHQHADLSRCRSDVNGNGRPDSIDAALILQYEAGILHELPS
jgi:hypothetical protein